MPNITITLLNQQVVSNSAFADVTICTPNNSDAVFANISSGTSYTVHPSVITKIVELLQQGCIAQTSVNQTTVAENSHAQQMQQNILTLKEKQVLQLLAKGYSYKMIASELRKSIETIRVQLKKIYKKLQVNSNTGAVSKYQSLGM